MRSATIGNTGSTLSSGSGFMDLNLSSVTPAHQGYIPAGRAPDKTSCMLDQRVAKPCTESMEGLSTRGFPTDFTFLNNLSIPSCLPEKGVSDKTSCLTSKKRAPTYTGDQADQSTQPWPTGFTFLENTNFTLCREPPEQGEPSGLQTALPENIRLPSRIEPDGQAEPLPPLSLKLMQKEKNGCLYRAAQAIEATVNDITLISAGSGGAVLEYQQNGRDPVAIKLHFGFHQSEIMPHEIDTMRQLTIEDVPSFSYAPGLLGYAYSRPAELWLHTMTLYPATLGDLIATCSDGMEESVVRTLIRDLLQGLSELNKHGFMHRDIKPNNLLLTQKTLTAVHHHQLETIKPPLIVIADYGLAKPVEKKHQDGRHTPHIGTYRYRPCYTDKGDYNESIDVSSVGMIFYELLTGQRFLDKLCPVLPVKGETPKQCEQRKLKEQENLSRGIKERLTGGQAIKNQIRDKEKQTQWQAWIKLAGGKPEDYPIQQYLGLFRLIYGGDARSRRLQQSSDGQAHKLSGAGFLALCDLLKITGPDNAARQLQREYWQAPAAFSTAASVDTSMPPGEGRPFIQEEFQQGVREEQGAIQGAIIGGANICEYCSGQKKYHTVKSLRLHQSNHVLCPVCQQYPEIGLKGLVEHINKNHSKKERESILKKIIIWQGNPEKMDASEAEKKSYRQLSEVLCTYHGRNGRCNKFFENRGLLKRHRSTHGRTITFECGECEYRTHTQKNLLRHQSKSADIHLPCPVCTTKWSAVRRLVEHIKKKHQEGFEQLLGDIIRWQDNSGDIEASEAKKKSYSRLSEVLCTYRGPKRQCNTLHISTGALRLHQCSHIKEKAFECSDCDYRANCKRNVLRHQKNCKGFHLPCPVCTITIKCSTVRSLVEHIKKMHEKELESLSENIILWRKNPDDVAAYEVKASYCALSKVLCTYSVNDKLCGKLFEDKSQLEIHQTTHTGERPYVCQLCKKSYKLPRYLKQHQRLHLDDEKVREATKRKSQSSIGVATKKNKSGLSQVSRNTPPIT